MSFGLHFGELVRLHRGEQGLSQRELAIRAFDDESRKSRISELENGKVANPDQAIVDALIVALNLSTDDVSACREKGRQRTGILTFEQHEKNVRERLAGLEERLKAATDDRAVIQQQADEARRRLDDLEADYERTRKELAEAKALLDRYDNQFEKERGDAARRALDRDDRTLADALFAEAQDKLTAQAGDFATEAAKLAYERGVMAEDDMRWQDADRHYSEAARLAPTYDNLIKAGLFAIDCGDYSRSAQINQQCVELAEVEFGSDDPRTATAFNNLAESLRHQGRYSEAEPFFRQALEISEEKLGGEHPVVAARLNNLAILLGTLGRAVEAEIYARRALRVGTSRLGADHPDVASFTNILAVLLQGAGRYEEAESLFRRALKVCQNSFGPDHPVISIRLNNLAELLRADGRYVEAEPLFRRALVVCETAFGADHPTVRPV